MKIIRVSAIFLVLMTISVHQGSSAFLTDVWNVVKFSYNVASKIIEGESAYKMNTDDSGQKLDSIYSAVKDIMRDQQLIANRLEANVQQMINNLSKKLKNDVVFDRLKDKLTQDYIGRVNNIHKSFFNAIDRKYNDRTMCDLAIKTTSFGSNEIHDSLGKTSQLIFTERMSPYFTNFINILLEHIQSEASERCDEGISQQQEIYQLYELLVNTETKAFTVLSLAYSLKSKCLKANFTNEIKGAQLDMIQRVYQYMKTIKKAMAKVPTEIRRCEPTEYIRNKNFMELERYIRMIVIPEKETSETFLCSESCDTYNKTIAPMYSFDVQYNREILGKNCLSCESAGHTSICYPRDLEGSRLYLGVSANLKHQAPDIYYGDYLACNNREGYSRVKDYKSSYYSLTTRCDVCACKCLNYEIDPKWHYFAYLKPQLSDIDNNMIVTGIRFNHMRYEISGHIIYPQIKVGKLLPSGEVIDEMWQYENKYEILHDKHNNPETLVKFGVESNEARYINLDDSYAEPGHIVTGVRFILVKDMLRVRRPWYVVLNDVGLSLSIAIRTTPCNFATGQLSRITTETTYVHPDQPSKLEDFESTLYDPSWREELDLEDMDLPTKSKNAKPDSKDRQYLRFSASHKFKDFGQSTVPFIDLQPVETSPPSPLSGIGLFHKGEKEYGGFLAFKLMTLNMTDVINTDISEEDKIKLGL